MMILITGGSASGKSQLAENLALQMGKAPRCYLATMDSYDEESKQRIDRHQKMRGGKAFETLERSCDLSGIFHEALKFETILLECLTNLVANELFISQKEEKQAVDDVLHWIDWLSEQIPVVVVVSGELFGDGGKYTEETLRYLRVLGLLNQAIAQRASIVVEVVCGLMIVHKGKEMLADEKFG